MSREIKFRAWGIKESIMHTVAEIVWMAAYGKWYGPGVGSGIWFIDPEYKGERSHNKVDSYLMQFTGLTDKNGKEIYEGDIVESVDELSNDQYQVDDRVFTEAVELKAGAFYPVCNMPSEEFEVIGNIHENPELL